METWRAVAGYEGLYEVSDLGRVRSLPRDNGLNGTAAGGRVLKGTLSVAAGYVSVKLSANGRKKTMNVHSLVATTFLGPRPEGLVVRHLDGDTCNNNLTNLRYGTPSQNGRDTVRHGRNVNASKTHCPNDHPYDDKNTYDHADGHRRCKICARERARRWYHKNVAKSH
jgi:hypothetical protein